VSQVIFNDRLAPQSRPCRITSVDDNVPESINEIVKDLKCQHLASVLKSVLEGRSEKDKHSLVAMLAGTKVSRMNGGKEALLTRAKHRLQETLLKGIFGDDGEQFIGALQMPESVEGWDAKAPQVERGEGWPFVGTVWSTVGWDLVLKG
jgi:hypothetical protein